MIAPRPFSIGALRVEKGVLAAPMCGATKLPFRRLARRFGADVTYTEMVKAHLVVEGSRKTLELLARGADEDAVGAQLCGGDPEVLARAAERVEALGFGLVDLNMGCPVKKVVQTGAGAALLRDPARVEAAVAACAQAVSIPVTAKIRSGWADYADAAVLARAVEAGGAAAIAIHGRTRAQRHEGEVDHEALARAKAAVSIPVIANGGVRNGEGAVRMLAETGCDAVMIGRGAYGRPWVFRDVARALRGEAPLPPPSGDALCDVVREHLEGMVELMGDHGVLVFRKYAGWYMTDPADAPLLDRAHRTREAAGMREVLAAWRERLTEPTLASG